MGRHSTSLWEVRAEHFVKFPRAEGQEASGASATLFSESPEGCLGTPGVLLLSSLISAAMGLGLLGLVESLFCVMCCFGHLKFSFLFNVHQNREMNVTPTFRWEN